MTTQSSKYAWPCCIALLTALFSTASVAASTTIPLRATISFAEQVTPSTVAGCALTGRIAGAGTAVKLGTVALTSIDCINPLSPKSFLFLSDELVLTLDTGEQIWAAYGGSLSATNGAIKGGYFVFGGTGRFENARGAGTIEGSEAIDFSIGAGSGQIELKGTIAY